jgi:hypothetical protein
VERSYSTVQILIDLIVVTVCCQCLSLRSQRSRSAARERIIIGQKRPPPRKHLERYVQVQVLVLYRTRVLQMAHDEVEN